MNADVDVFRDLPRAELDADMGRRRRRAAPPSGAGITEDAVALAFVANHGAGWRFDHEAGAWFGWQGDHWRRDVTAAPYDICRSLARDATATLAARDQSAARRSSFARGAETMARHDRAMVALQSDWDRDPFLMGAPGVTVDLRTGRARPADPGDGITKRAAVAPADTADCPRWLAFLEDATGGDADMIRWLRAWCGYNLTGDTREHQLAFVFGDGGNGKSAFATTVAGIMGDYAVTASMDTFTASRNDRHPTDLAMLRGARMVTASETEEGRLWAEARIKQMTGGDPITARFMHQDFFTFHPEFKLTIIGNHKPVLANVDDAAKRRFNMLPFTRKPRRPDPDLPAKLRAEWPAILRWMLDGCADWQAAGLIRPASVTAATAEYFGDQDLFGQWIEAECTVELDNTHRWETSARLFAAWTVYAKACGEEPGSSKRFGEAMRRRGFERTVKKIDGKAMKCWAGINLPQPEAAQWDR